MDNIKLDPVQIRCGDVDWIIRDKWRVLGNAVMNLRIP
jgi:hypothetical protein